MRTLNINHILVSTWWGQCVKFGIYAHQTTIFKGVLNKILNFLSPYYYLTFLIYTYQIHHILIIIHCFILLHTLYYN
jgi:hypothetical protein